MKQYPWATLLIAPAGFAAMAWLSRRFFPGTDGSGIPQAIAASMADNGLVRRQLLSFRIAIAKTLLTLGGLLSGASIGTEARPQIGDMVMFGKLRCKVMRYHDRGIGVQFLDIPDPEALRRYFG